MLQSKQQVGRLDKRITIEQKVIITNASNEDEEIGWEEFTQVWSDVEEKSGSENYEADQKVARTTAQFRIRHLAGLIETMRIIYNSRIYDIKAILYMTRSGYIHITGESGGQYVESDLEGAFSAGFSSGFNI